MDREENDISRETEQDFQKGNEFSCKKCRFYEGEMESLAHKNDEMSKMLAESKREIRRLTQTISQLTQKVAENDKLRNNRIESTQPTEINENRTLAENNVPDLNKFLEIQMVVPKEEPADEFQESERFTKEGNASSRMAAVASQTEEESGGNGVTMGDAPDPSVVERGIAKETDSDAESFLICLWTVRGGNALQPRRCRKRFANAAELGSHFGEEHLELAARSGYVCSWEGCKRSGQPLENRNNLAKHFRTHSGERPYPCPYEGCGKAFADQTTVRWHINTHSRTTFPCTYPGCDMAYSHKQSMINHYRVRHTGERGFGCLFEDCGMVFNKAAELRKHSHRHAGPKPHLCAFPRCTQAFETKAGRDGHFAQHGACASHECPYEGCGKSFAYSFNLREHVRAHTGEKPYRCPYGCGKFFARARNVKSHVDRQHKDAVFTSSSSTSSSAPTDEPQGGKTCSGTQV